MFNNTSHFTISEVPHLEHVNSSVNVALYERTVDTRRDVQSMKRQINEKGTVQEGNMRKRFTGHDKEWRVC